MPVRENFISALHADWDQQCLCYQDRHPDKEFSQSLQKHLEITVLLLIFVPVDANWLTTKFYAALIHQRLIHDCCEMAYFSTAFMQDSMFAQNLEAAQCKIYLSQEKNTTEVQQLSLERYPFRKYRHHLGTYKPPLGVNMILRCT